MVIKLLEEGPGVSLIGGNGQESVYLSVWRDGPHITLADANGMRGISLRVAPSGTKELFKGELGSEAQPTVGPSLKLEVTDDGPCLRFSKDNKVFWSAP